MPDACTRRAHASSSGGAGAQNGGGATHFPQLNLTVQPTSGSALMWPNVLDEDLRRVNAQAR